MTIIVTRGRNGRRVNVEALGNRYKDAVTRLEKSEAKMRRVFHEYEKHAATVRSYERQLDRLQRITDEEDQT